jgi:predicted 3-demethylubiquinone-9 3-methyltransferase (glyoxalase superfamily)
MDQGTNIFMSNKIQGITPFLWFDSQAEEAAGLYTSLFPGSRIVEVVRYSPEMANASGRPVDSAMTVVFTLDERPFTAFNGGPHLRMNGSVSLVVNCMSQDDVDYYWDRLGQGGNPDMQQCGWLLDRYGMSWQILPARLLELMASTTPGVADRVAVAMLGMKKIELAELERAAK